MAHVEPEDDCATEAADVSDAGARALIVACSSEAAAEAVVGTGDVPADDIDMVDEVETDATAEQGSEVTLVAGAALCLVPQMYTFGALITAKWFGRMLGGFLSQSPRPRCKLLLFLQLRVTSCTVLKACFMSNMLVDRINVLAKHKLVEVRIWAIRVVESGWLHQCFPAMRVGRHPRLLRYGTSSIPSGMRQRYFDTAMQIGTRRLGWDVCTALVPCPLFTDCPSQCRHVETTYTLHL